MARLYSRRLTSSLITTSVPTTLISVRSTSVTDFETATTTVERPTTLVQVTTQVNIQSTTVVQSATQTVTQSIDPTGFANTCWDMKKDICSGKMQVPPDRRSNGFGECKQVFAHFYCGMIVEFENYGLIIVPTEASPLCDGMHDYCKEVEPSIF